MTDSEKLPEILNNFAFKLENPAFGEPAFPQAHSAILDWAKGLVPEETPEPHKDDCDWQLELAQKAGHDICRSQLLAKIEGMRKT